MLMQMDHTSLCWVVTTTMSIADTVVFAALTVQFPTAQRLGLVATNANDDGLSCRLLNQQSIDLIINRAHVYQHVTVQLVQPVLCPASARERRLLADWISRPYLMFACPC